MPLLLDGKSLASKIELELRERIISYQKYASLRWHTVSIPSLATILVGNNPTSIKYINMKHKAAKRIGICHIDIRFPDNVTEREVLDRIDKLNTLWGVDGIMIQHPLPERLRSLERNIFDTICPEKDVDGLTTTNFGRLCNGKIGFKPATPKGIMSLLSHNGIEISGMRTTIIGASPILGKPLAILMLEAGSTVSVCQKFSRSTDIRNLCRKSDIIVGACGVPNLIKKEWVKKGVILIDAGCSPGNIGDIDPEAREKCFAYTPVPGGVGPMTIISLLGQTYEASRRRMYDRDNR
jgi:methylenetetrahydrofolate dehydrogenase (NADP+) / methenyltetrahydrofolate cyclohydrolase